jgi:nucleotide-binding universal stress UspA family protein
MNQVQHGATPIIDRILHPTDFSEGSLVAFHHALKIALLTRAGLTLLHVSPQATGDFSDFPGVRETLERWGLLPKNSPRSAVPQLGIDVHKVIAQHDNPVKAVLDYLPEYAPDLIVLATHQHEGRASWLRQSVAKPVARRAGQMTLFIPGASAGFVSAADGASSLRNILVPLAASPLPQPAVDVAARLPQPLNCTRGTFTLLHVGADSMPAVSCPDVPGWQWNRVTRIGDVVQGILDTASDSAADLILMATDGRNGFLDALRGSHSERVLRHAAAPLLTVPVGSAASAHIR